MYGISDKDFAGNLQRKLNSSGLVDSPPKGFPEENVNLTDSVLEYHDPTPNIHDLFVLFDKKFFWEKLGMVEVKWSNKMTSCAGLCYYQGKSGLCSIKLSAPLLSLRPRKDLVETLLHEMIHAYLFVTKNYRDREDHGPEFHKHMNRINQIAGTKISVYHTFLDEVAYYQKHIWRCNGPCQYRKPYYGFIKRAMNRPPGPNDNWWNEHQQNCNGFFIKISEPEKTLKKNSRHKQGNSVHHETGMKDIRKFFPTNANHTIISSASCTNSSNIYTLSDSRISRSPISDINKLINNQTLMSANVKQSDAKLIPKINTVDSKEDVNESTKVKETVRNIWATKFPSPNESIKRSHSTSSNFPKEINVDMKRQKVSCPICYLSFSETVINEHVEECLLNGQAENSLEKKLPIHESVTSKYVLIETQCQAQDAEPQLETAQCAVCNKVMNEKDINEHLEVCLKFTFGTDEFDQEDEVILELVPCPCCMKCFPEKNMNSHIDECLTFIALKNNLRND